MITKITDFKLLEPFSKYIYIDDPFLNCYAYYIKDEIVSIILFSIQYDRAELNYIWTDEQYRNQGIATKLINKMFCDCKHMNNVTLEVDVKNREAINLYHKLGFTDVSVRKRYYENGNDALLMMKEMK